MAKTGRPAIPAQVKVLTGARIREDKGDTFGAEVEIEMPPCPAWIKGNARKHWDTLGAALVGVGLLSVIDGDMFSIHCDNVARYGEVREKLENLEDWLAKTPNGFLVQAGYVQILNKLQEQIKASAREFGLTPAARSGMKVQPKQGDLFGGAGGDPDPYDNYEIRKS